MALRSEASRQAVLKATMQLLGDRPPGPISVQRLTIEAIAKQAGVGKATIYRWWPTKAAVVIDSFVDHHTAATPVDDELPVDEALTRHVESLITLYTGVEGRLIAQIIAECQYDETTLSEFRNRFWDSRTQAVVGLIERGVKEGVIRADVAPLSAADLIYSPIYQRLLLQTGPLDGSFARELVALALQGLAAPRSDRGQRARTGTRRPSVGGRAR